MNRVWIAVGVVLALVGAFVGGRFSAPLKVETRDVARVVYQDKIVEKVVTVEVKAKAETKIVYRDRVVTRDGTVTEHEVEKTDTKEDDKKSTDDGKTEVATGETQHEHTVITTLRPNWRVGITAGASLRAPLVTLAGPLVIGVQVDRRLIGGLSTGVWANSYGAAGLGVSFEF